MELAVFTDCRKLIENFVKTKDTHFPAFCEQWKALKFQHIYAAQTTYVEVMQTTAAALHVAKRTVCPLAASAHTEEVHTSNEDKILRRIGGLYLMYAIYFKQPTEKFIKVEMSLETWVQLKEFITSLPMTVEMDDVRYIYLKLRQSNAFRYTALDQSVSLERFVDYDKVDEEYADAQPTSTKFKEELTEYTETKKITPALVALEEGYNEMKEMLAAAQGLPAQALPPTTIFKDINRALQKVQTLIDEPTETELLRTKKSTTKPKMESTKRHLKRKGFKANATEQDNVEDDEDDSDAEARPQCSKTRLARRMSARTVFTDELPLEMLRDLEQGSELEDLAQENEKEDLEQDCEPDQANDNDGEQNTCKAQETTMETEKLITSKKLTPKKKKIANLRKNKKRNKKK